MENPVVIDRGDRSAADDVHAPSGRWQDVHDLSFNALLTQTKDIELLAWLAESTIRVNGFEALDEVLAATSALIVTHLSDLHSADDDSNEDRVSPLGGLNGSQDSDGTLIRPLRLNSLSPTNIYGRFSLWSLDKAKKTNNSALLSEFHQEFSNLDGELFVARVNAVQRSLVSINQIDSALTQAYGADAPSFGRIRDVLEDIGRALSELGAHVHMPATPAPVFVAGPEAAPVTTNGVAAPIATPGQIVDRDQALRMLLDVAAFFKRTEPHSTIPMALETLVRRGRMDFVTLLAELLPDENQRKEMLTRAGIKTDTA